MVEDAVRPLLPGSMLSVLSPCEKSPFGPLASEDYFGDS